MISWWVMNYILRLVLDLYCYFPQTPSTLSDTELAAELKLACGNTVLVPPSEFMTAHTNFLSLTTHCSLLIFFASAAKTVAYQYSFRSLIHQTIKVVAFSLWQLFPWGQSVVLWPNWSSLFSCALVRGQRKHSCYVKPILCERYRTQSVNWILVE